MTNISINKLHEFRDHPYQVLDNDEMNNLIKSVQQQGIITPLIVRPLEGTTDEYEIISGHRHFRAVQKAGLAGVPAFIRSVSRDGAAIMVVDSNLPQGAYPAVGEGICLQAENGSDEQTRQSFGFNFVASCDKVRQHNGNRQASQREP